MALLKRQLYSVEYFDDQSPELANSFVGNWTHTTYGEGIFYNNTITVTETPGSTFTVTFSGSQAVIYGGLLNNTNSDGTTFLGWPTASYVVDGISSGSQMPYYSGDDLVYFATQVLKDGKHTVDVTVTATNETSQYIFDLFAFIPTAGAYSSGVESTSMLPSSTGDRDGDARSVPVGAIVGGVVGGVAAVAILAIIAWYFLFRRSRRGQAYYFEKPSAAEVLAGEAHVEPFNSTPATSPPPSSAGFSRPGPQSAYSDGSSRPLNRETIISTQSGPSETGLTYVSGSTQPRTGKAALITQQYEEVEPVQFQDSGIRFNEPAAGPSQLPTEVPPTYTPN